VSDLNEAASFGNVGHVTNKEVTLSDGQLGAELDDLVA